VWTVIALTVPILAAYVGLQARGAQLGTNASYDAYKLFAVFQPLLLPAFCWWVTLRCSRRLHEWLLVGAAGVVMVGFNLAACGMFVWKLSRPALMVDEEIPQLRRIEAMPEVKSVNMIFAEADMWSRLWASAYLLRKEQYFLSDTYEARWSTPLRGDWDLEGGLASVDLPGAGRRQVTPRFALVDTRHPLFLRVMMTEGWHGTEVAPGQAERWQWTRGDAVLRVENPHRHPLAVACALDAWSPLPRAMALELGGKESPGSRSLGDRRSVIEFPLLEIPPGISALHLKSPQPPTHGPGDPRPLGAAVFRFRVAPQR
jgi:hypothetical protein